jgi:hypothetical protein
VLRPLKAAFMSIYHSIMMVSEKLLRHRLTIERWLTV